MASKINIERYISEIKRRMSLNIDDDIIKKDLLLTLILAEFEKMDLGKELIFKGGTLLSRNYLNYHRFSEDLDFTADKLEIKKLSSKIVSDLLLLNVKGKIKEIKEEEQAILATYPKVEENTLSQRDPALRLTDRVLGLSDLVETSELFLPTKMVFILNFLVDVDLSKYVEDYFVLAKNELDNKQKRLEWWKLIWQKARANRK